MAELRRQMPDAQCPSTIGFRLDEAGSKLLVERAKSLGVSVHQLARHYVITMLSENEERDQLGQMVEKMYLQIAEIRKDIGISTEALLSSAGKTEKSKAKEWVGNNLHVE